MSADMPLNLIAPFIEQWAKEEDRRMMTVRPRYFGDLRPYWAENYTTTTNTYSPDFLTHPDMELSDADCEYYERRFLGKSRAEPRACEYCGVGTTDPDRMKCEQCGAPLPIVQLPSIDDCIRPLPQPREGQEIRR